MIKATIILMMLLQVSCGHASSQSTRWQEDVDFYAHNLIERHIDPFNTISQSEFKSEVARIKEIIPHSETNEILVELMRLTRKLNDGHTSFPLWGLEHDSFPLGLKLFGDDLYVVKTTREHKDILGSRLVSINGSPASEVIRLLAELTPFSENRFSTAVRVAEYLPKFPLLNGLGIVESDGKALFEFDVDGSVQKRQLEPSPSPDLSAHISHLNDILFSAKEKVSDDLWFGASADGNTVYLKFRRYTSVSKMEKFAEQLLDFIDDHSSENVIIDLRDNYGGDFFVGLKLAQLLVLADSVDWKSGVYVLIDNVTFSAAMSNAAQFSQILNGKLVGEPTGAKPSGYQDMGQFTLPNSKIEVTYSKRLYHFKEDKKDAIYPDVNIEVVIEDFRNETDTQLRWVLSDIDKKLAVASTENQ